MTCHYNGLGGGPLTDYGRALWSSEIAARPFYNRHADDEAIANQSGFLGSVALPVWFRPHVKYRGLQLRTNPGSGSSDSSLWLNMQEDFGVTLQSDDSAKYLATITWGRVVLPQNYGLGTQGFEQILAREYYLRAEAFPGWWIYAGLMEKVFGLRNVDHESYQRKYQGFQVYNNTPDGIGTSLGLILHKIAEKWEIAFNYFSGNPYDLSSFQQKGGSSMGEIEVGDNKRLGASVLTSQNSVKKKDLAALHYRQQILKGSSLMLEYGLIHDQASAANDAVGSYNLLRGVFLMIRGYNFTVTTERYNQMFNPSVTDNWKWTVGFLVFPMPRMELRADVTNYRGLTTQSGTPDTWSMQGQVHVSL